MNGNTNGIVNSEAQKTAESREGLIIRLVTDVLSKGPMSFGNLENSVRKTLNGGDSLDGNNGVDEGELRKVLAKMKHELRGVAYFGVPDKETEIYLGEMTAWYVV